MIAKDKEDKYKYELSMLEHLASFINPEGVRRVREARENSVSMADEDFRNLVESIGGVSANF